LVPVSEKVAKCQQWNLIVSVSKEESCLAV